MPEPRRLDLAAIKTALQALQGEFPRINRELLDRRDPLTDEVLDNLLAGYRRVDQLLASDTQLFRRGESARLLELNQLVLCGAQGDCLQCSPRQLKVNERHFYSTDGGVESLMNWLEWHATDAISRRAAGVFIHVLSQPQLYMEGNHRTGALLMSYLLAREGLPPFVLTVHNARHFFDPATLVKKSRRRGLDNLLKIPKLKKRFARLIEQQLDDRYLLPH